MTRFVAGHYPDGFAGISSAVAESLHGDFNPNRYDRANRCSELDG